MQQQQTGHRPLAGVDGCKAGWYAIIERAPADLHWMVLPTFAALLEALPAPGIIAIDVPIGLQDGGSRPCDLLARQLLGPKRGSSVYAAPIRATLGATSHAEASAIRRSAEGKGMSIQAYAIVPKIREVDAALREMSDAAARERVYEVHPEVTFTELNGGAPVVSSKKRAPGRAARTALLRPHFGELVERFVAERPKKLVEADDVIDAFAGVWSGRRIRAGGHRTIPAPAERDAAGLRMAISA